jgi:hypothetical protein
VVGPLLFLFLFACQVHLLVVSGYISQVASCCLFKVLGKHYFVVVVVAAAALVVALPFVI